MFGKREEPEEFSDRLLKSIETKRLLKTEEERYLKIIDEIRESKISLELIVEQVLKKIEEVKHALEELKQDRSEADVSESIVTLLSQTESMSFTELLDGLGVAKTTLARHLNRLVQEDRVERIETDKKVLYRLKK